MSLEDEFCDIMKKVRFLLGPALIRAMAGIAKIEQADYRGETSNALHLTQR